MADPTRPPDGRPLVLTLRLDEKTERRLGDERRELFPAGRTAVGAHVTLFHALPPHLLAHVEAELDRLATAPAFTVEVTEVYPLGRGVAYRLAGEELLRLHRALQDDWRGHLTRQDAQRFRPHVTVQNKVEPDVARATLHRLRSTFRPWQACVVGVQLWRYAGGPWVLLRTQDLAARK